jgi:hypothetical protein
MKTKLYMGPIQTPSRLTELGLEEESLLQAVQHGQSAWASCTPNHPPLYRGISAWAETIGALREVLMPRAWNRSDNGNLPLTVNELRTIAIIVSTGDEATGKRDGIPSTKSSKGPRTADAVTINAAQASLFEIRLQPEDLEDNSGMMTWILLFHRDTEAQQIRSEFSRPIEMSSEGYVDRWAERIILSPMTIGGDSIKVPTRGAPQTPVIEVEVKKRA